MDGGQNASSNRFALQYINLSLDIYPVAYIETSVRAHLAVKTTSCSKNIMRKTAFLVLVLLFTSVQ